MHQLPQLPFGPCDSTFIIPSSLLLTVLFVSLLVYFSFHDRSHTRIIFGRPVSTPPLHLLVAYPLFTVIARLFLPVRCAITALWINASSHTQHLLFSPTRLELFLGCCACGGVCLASLLQAHHHLLYWCFPFINSGPALLLRVY